MRQLMRNELAVIILRLTLGFQPKARQPEVPVDETKWERGKPIEEKIRERRGREAILSS